MSSTNSFQQKLLIAMPQLKSQIFGHSVVYIHQDNSEGTAGVILNVPMDMDRARSWSDQTGWEYPERIYHGGPVNQNIGYILHTSDYAHERTVQLDSNMSYTNGRSIIRDIERDAGPRDFILMTGYATWTPGQLADEVAAGYWQVADYNTEYFFRHEDREDGWVASVEIFAAQQAKKLLERVDIS